MKFHILTAVTRPENLPEIAASIAEAAQKVDAEVVWHWRFDPEGEHVGGQALKNAMLDGIDDGWVYILDDDTTMHPELLAKVASYDAPAVVVSQRGSGLQAKPGHVHIGAIDAGQAVMRREVIGDKRIEHSYAGDGLFLEQVLFGLPGVVFLSEELSHYNALRGWRK